MIPPIQGVYAIIDPDACRGRDPRDVARLAIEGGARVLQWRDKRRDKGDQLASARAFVRVCREAGALSIINDHADLAVVVMADGVHVGQHDLPVYAVRQMLGVRGIVGVSTNNADEAVQAERRGADYVAVGAIFPTSSKETTRAADLERIRAVKRAVRIPVVAIGGINEANIAQVVAAGADASAVIGAICGADDIRAATVRLAAAFDA
jgi:thiamine-phosphate pyrophosphorylase